METSQSSEIFSLILDLGALMLKCGAEVYRVEDTVSRLIIAYGGRAPQVFAVPTHLVATAAFENGEISASRRVLSPGTNLEVVDKVNTLARFACKKRPDAETFQAILAEAANFKGYTPAQSVLIYAGVSGSFTVLFGGSWADMLCSAVIGALLYFLFSFSRRVSRNAIFSNIICAAVSALLAMGTVKLGLADSADMVIIGNVMLLIPGVELVNSMRDFIVGDTQAGIMHFTEAMFLAVGIALGAAAVLTFLGGAL